MAVNESIFIIRMRGIFATVTITIQEVIMHIPVIGEYTPCVARSITQADINMTEESIVDITKIMDDHLTAGATIDDKRFAEIILKKIYSAPVLFIALSRAGETKITPMILIEGVIFICKKKVFS